MEKVNTFILAAGFGERLRPITTHLPKPLLPILGTPVLETVIEHVTSHLFGKIGMNVHYRWQMIRDWISKSGYSDVITLFIENEILGTGGGLKNAESFLKGSCFLVHNSDIVSDINLTKLVEHHLLSGDLVTLAVHIHSGLNNVWINSQGKLKFVGKNPPQRQKGLRPVAFTGIAVYSPEFLDFLPAGKSGVVEAWMRAASSGRSIGTKDFTGCSWSDIGTPDAYSSFIFDILKKEGELLYVHPSIDSQAVKAGANTVIEEGCILKAGTVLRNCILLPGAVVDEDSTIENSIVGPDFIIPINEALSMPSSLSSSLLSGFLDSADPIMTINLIGTGGSDRKYYRIKDNEKTAVLMECSGSDPDFQRHLIYTHFFRKESFPVPELLGTDTGSSSNPAMIKRKYVYALFEDLGDTSLYSWLKFHRNAAEAQQIYMRVIDIIAKLHSFITKNVSECLLLKSRIFDYEHLVWESFYFTSSFVQGIKGIVPAEKQKLHGEFHNLAKIVDSFRKTIVHRDFQSQNIFITGENVPRIIDFQGARMGPPGYDVASLLWDPYYSLDEAMRGRLLAYYIEKIKEQDSTFSEEEFLKTLLPCRLQRHMQALGAYGYLAKEKGKKYFLKYVPRALGYLKEETELVRNEYPELYGLVKDLDEKTPY